MLSRPRLRSAAIARAMGIASIVLAATAGAAAPASASPRVKVTPSAVRPGDPVLVRGSGFGARARVKLALAIRGRHPARSLVARADRRGKLSRALSVPARAPEGQYALSACRPGCRSPASARLRVTTTGAWTRWVRSGRIEVGHGAAGIAIGMRRSEVLAALGRPLFTTVYGYMQYAPLASNLFDVYTDSNASTSPVRLIIISFGRFRLDGVDVFGRGALAELKRRHPHDLRRTRTESGEILYRFVTDRVDGPVWTDLMVDDPGAGVRARILDVLIVDVR